MIAPEILARDAQERRLTPRKIRVCLICDYVGNFLGGAERQVLAIAELLEGRGFDVTIISKSGDNSRTQELQSGVKVRQVGRVRSKGVGKYIDFANLILGMREAIRGENADVYYQRTASIMTGFVGLFCQQLGKPFIFGSSSYWDSNDNLNGHMREDTVLSTLRMASPVYRYGLKNASAIVTQTEEMKHQFERRFPMKYVTRIPSVAILKSSSPEKALPPFVLYVSRLFWYRRPLIFLEVAKALPEINFVLAGYGPLEDIVRRESRSIGNLTFLGRVTPEESAELMRSAALFLNTSLIEGFPNTLLEALASRTSYVTLFDPDEVVCRYGLGGHGRTLREVISLVKTIMEHPEVRLDHAKNGEAYLRELHDPEVVAGQYERLLLEQVGQGSTGRS